MTAYDSPARRRAARALDGAMLLVVILLVVQIWLLMTSVELWLAGHREVVLPAALLSGGLFAGCAGLLTLARRADRTARAPAPRTARRAG